MHRRERRSLASGFTLIELLVVIAIIAILAAILFPVFAQAREKARQTQCISNSKQLGLALLMYVQDYDEHFAFGGWRPGTADGGQDGTWDWQNTIAPYIKNRGLYRCPDSADSDENYSQPTVWAWNQNPVSYLYNNQLGQNRTPVPEAAVIAPSDCVAFTDGHSDWGCSGPANGGNGCEGTDWMGTPNSVWLNEDTTFGSDASLVTGWLSWQGYTWGLPRHSGNVGADWVYTDGHVKYHQITPQGLTYPSGNTALPAPGVGYLEHTYPYNTYFIPQQNNTGWQWTYS